jgi:hypothetical protein
MATAMRVVGNKEGEGSKAIAMATRVEGKCVGTAMKRAMATTTREAGKEEGNGKDDKSNDNGKEDGDYEQQQ